MKTTVVKTISVQIDNEEYTTINKTIIFLWDVINAMEENNCDTVASERDSECGTITEYKRDEIERVIDILENFTEIY